MSTYSLDLFRPESLWKLMKDERSADRAAEAG
jgi:hypothetical protein